MMQACDKPDGFVPLPYSVGVLAAYALQNRTIKEKYELCGLLVDKLNPKICVGQFDSPDVVAFSCYLWNYEYSKCIAKKVKETYPNCVVIFGGHSIPVSSGDLLSELSYVDYLIHGEGEAPFAELLLCLSGNKSLDEVHNISYRKGGDIQYRYDPDYTVEDYPSPYLTGVFDEFINHGKNKYTATLETNRGCPFNCAFCDWGLNRSRLRMRDIRKVFDEIEWMGKNKIMVCYGADSNFGMFPRDLEIARKISEVKERYGYPRKFSVSFSKQSNQKVLEICKVLNGCEVLAGVTLSFQSLNKESLDIVRRSNLSIEYFQKLIREYNKEHIPTYSELILGLPGETYDSFVSGICELIARGQYRYINVYNFALLTNSELGRRESIEKYKIQTVKIPSNLYYCQVRDNENEVLEYSDIVVETLTMSKRDWVNCRMFTSIIKGFHSYGILLYIATFLHNSKELDYRSFYESLYKWIIDTECFPPYTEQYEWLKDVVSERKKVVKPQDTYGHYKIPAEEVAFLKIKEDANNIYLQLSDFLNKFKSIQCWDELLRFQKTVFGFVYDIDNKDMEFSYDFVRYFNSVALGEIPALTLKKSVVTKATLKEMILVPKKIYVSETQHR